MSSCSGIVVTAGGFSSKWFSITKKGSARQSGGGGGGGKGGLCIAYKLWLILFGTSVDLHCITFHCLCQYSDGPFMCRQYQIVECALEANRSLSKYILSIDYSSILWTVCVAVDMAKSLQKKKKKSTAIPLTAFGITHIVQSGCLLIPHHCLYTNQVVFGVQV